MESFKKGDRVTLTEPLGHLTTEDIGLIVEVYGEDQAPDDVAGSLDYTMFRGIWDYGVAFPRLRQTIDPESAAWITDKVDLSQFHAGDVLPVGHRELKLADSTLREDAE